MECDVCCGTFFFDASFGEEHRFEVVAASEDAARDAVERFVRDSLGLPSDAPLSLTAHSDSGGRVDHFLRA